MDGGDGNSFDPCECICSHEGAMRRLISLLRSSQSYCTDNQCLQELPGPQSTDNGTEGFSMMYVMMVWMFIAFLLYLFRPQTLRQGGDKRTADDRPPPPPPAPGVHWGLRHAKYPTFQEWHEYYWLNIVKNYWVGTCSTWYNNLTIDKLLWKVGKTRI